MEKLKLIRFVFTFSKHYWRRMFLYSLISLCGSLLLVPSAFIYKNLIDETLTYIMSPDGELHPPLWMGAILIAIYFTLNTLRFFSNYFWRYIGSEATRDLSLRLYGKIVRTPLRDYKKVSTGEYISMLATDCDKFANFALGFVSGVTLGVIRMFIQGAVLLSLSPSLLVLLLSIIPAYLLFYKRHVNALADTAEMERRVWGNLVNSLTEFLGNILLIKERAATEFSKKMLSSRLRSQLEYRKDILKTVGKNEFARSIFNDLMPIGLLVFGSYLLTLGYLSIGALMSFITYSGVLTRELSILFYRFLRLSAVKPHAERISNLLEAEMEEHGKRLASVDVLELRNVSFSYEGEHVLHGITLSLGKKETVAIVGESGVGKSTLALMMAGLLRPDSGDVLINGVRIDKYSKSSLRGKIAYVPQSPPLLTMSLRDNIMFGHYVSEEELLKILKVCKIEELAILLDKIMGSGGRELSDGQRQRVAIARALVVKPDMLILDEALSAVDAKVEGEVIKGIRAYLGDHAILVIISHRLSTIKDSGRIVVLDKGRIVGVGRHDELLRRVRTYAELIRRQLIRE